MNEYLKALGLSKDEVVFASHIEDLARACENKNTPVFSQFLDLRQQKIAKACVEGFGLEKSFFGGYADAERKMLGIFPDYVQECDREVLFPIAALCINHSRELSHRDFLGAFMSLGIKRELLGDILVSGTESFLLLNPRMCDYVTQNVQKVGNVGVKISRCELSDLNVSEQQVSEQTAIISSLRLDCVVAALSNKSRADAAKLVLGEKVSVNHQIANSTSKNVSQGDVLSIRSVGKFKICGVISQTKKGRLVLSYNKYI